MHPITEKTKNIYLCPYCNTIMYEDLKEEDKGKFMTRFFICKCNKGKACEISWSYGHEWHFCDVASTKKFVKPDKEPILINPIFVFR